VWLESQQERDREFPALRGFEAATVSMCAVPLIAGGATLGALRFSFTTRRLFDDDERAFVLALAAQTAQTLQRTERYEAERRASLELQRALLPAQLPAIEGWSAATHYSPAGEQEAGGDFFDVLPVSGGRTVALVGDVMGRGVEAAAAMAQIRTTIRAYAVDDAEPASVLRRVDCFFEHLDLQQIATALYFLIDGSTVRIANAGHLPPLMVDEDGCRVVPTAGGTPFGVGLGERDSVAVEVPPGAALVAITDGLVERRGEDIDEGLARVVAAAETAPDRRPGPLLQRLLDAASSSGSNQDDDVTILVLQRT
jgi:serine phosphatase RsbU (regulator of sigma subunit)